MTWDPDGSPARNRIDMLLAEAGHPSAAVIAGPEDGHVFISNSVPFELAERAVRLAGLDLPRSDHWEMPNLWAFMRSIPRAS